ncbi:MAG: glycosyl hydrolase [Bacteroidetes bacterium]|nr:MAG: glycosyl hydrolase [Bacteroidota bacterium]
MRYTFTGLAALLLLLLTVPDSRAQRTVSYDEALYDALTYRHLGPYRGGRSAAVTGVPGHPGLFYMGATGGGVWRTTDGGRSWNNISDGFFGGSIGAVAVSPSDPNVIYVGGGEKTVRGNVSHGYGMWKSVDAGKTWTPIGLEDTRHIPRIRIHPTNPDLVYVAALGHLFGPNEQRGVFRSKDGGQTWEKILYVNEHAGAVDLILDPSNPRILYATTWRVRRTPYSLESGGEGSGLWKSTDGGDTWTELTGTPNGLPRGTLGIIGVTVSPANPDRVWALVEARDGGVFRSEDAGATWRKVNDDRNLRQRAWYYTRLYADPQDADRLYVLNVQFWRSKDGGRTFESIDTPHGDHHDLWIDPETPTTMIVADDGGGQVTTDGGRTWTTYYNQPTAQFYRVTTDSHVPYRIYGAQQDNSTVRILHRSDAGGLSEADWEPTAGGESGWLAPKPDNPEIVFGGSYGGFLQMRNHATGETRLVNVWPDNPMGHGAEGMKYRFQWNFPILWSRHDPDVLYTAGNHLFRSTTLGESWEMISPDLTRADSSMLGPSGGPITKDNTGVEYYATLFALAESPHDPGVLWVGSDDGLIHVTRDGGRTWTNVTPPARLLPEWAQINEIVADPHRPGGAYVAATRYKSDDFAPYLYRTTDFGQTWTKITDGIDPLHFTRTIQPDPARPGLLYAGTESGMYVSFDDGASWQPFQLNLPVVPITDLDWKDDDLIVATQGRSFWVLNDLTLLHQLNEQVAASDWHLFQPRPAIRWAGVGSSQPGPRGDNPPDGVMLRYYFREAPDSSAVTLRILEPDGTVIDSFTPSTDEALPVEAGANQFVWDLRYPDAETFPGMILWAGNTRGPKAVPGTYLARLIVGTDSMTVPFEIRKDPRSSSTLADLQAQFDFLIEVRNTFTQTTRAIEQIRDVRAQVQQILDRLPDGPDADAVREAGRTLLDRMQAVEEALYQTKNQSRQDPLNFPIRLNNKIAALASTVAYGDFRPTEQAYAVKADLTQQIEAELTRLQDILQTDLPTFNQRVRDSGVPAVIVDPDALPSVPAVGSGG